MAVCHAFDIRVQDRGGPDLSACRLHHPRGVDGGRDRGDRREAESPYCVGRAQYGGNARGQIMGDLTGQVKLIVDPDTRTLIGVHIVGKAPPSSCTWASW